MSGVLADCPECRSAGSVTVAGCEVCYAAPAVAPGAKRATVAIPITGAVPISGIAPAPPVGSFDRGPDRAADQPPDRTIERPSPLRLVDVIRELRSIATLAADDGPEPDSSTIALACLRAETLLVALRAQFVDEVILADGSPSGSARP